MDILNLEHRLRHRLGAAVAISIAFTLVLAVEARANHSSGAHFAPSRGETTITLADCVGAPWDVYLRRFAVPQWSRSPSVELHLVRCSNPAADVDVRSRNYGYTPLGGWFKAWNDASGHYARAQVRFNKYWIKRQSERRLRHTVCHELGHSLGLDHREGATSCMRTGADITPSPRPHPHDFEQLRLLYSHTHE